MHRADSWPDVPRRIVASGRGMQMAMSKPKKGKGRATYALEMQPSNPALLEPGARPVAELLHGVSSMYAQKSAAAGEFDRHHDRVCGCLGIIIYVGYGEGGCGKQRRRLGIGSLTAGKEDEVGGRCDLDGSVQRRSEEVFRGLAVCLGVPELSRN